MDLVKNVQQLFLTSGFPYLYSRGLDLPRGGELGVQVPGREPLLYHINHDGSTAVYVGSKVKFDGLAEAVVVDPLTDALVRRIAGKYKVEVTSDHKGIAEKPSAGESGFARGLKSVCSYLLASGRGLVGLEREAKPLKDADVFYRVAIKDRTNVREIHSAIAAVQLMLADTHYISLRALYLSQVAELRTRYNGARLEEEINTLTVNSAANAENLIPAKPLARR